MKKILFGRGPSPRPMSTRYLVVFLAKNQLFPGSDQDVQCKPEKEAIVILHERVLSNDSHECEIHFITHASYLVTLRQTLPGFDEAFPHDVLILRRGVGVVVEYVGHVLVHVRQQRAELRPQKLVEQLLDAHAEGRLE